ncbi:MAG: FTR1 family iron permease [Acidobacteriota bacterium]|jgi:high-affinity iron transporter|nr:FTR1 family iron permease [Acidobacteriota bacterium]
MRVIFILLCIAAASAPALAGTQGVTEDYGPVVAEIVERGDKAVAAYAPADAVPTGNEFSRLYFDVFESSGMEFTLNLKDSSAMLKIESGFSSIISQCMRGEPKAEVEKTWAAMKRDMDYAVERYSSGGAEQGFRGRAAQSFLIIAREGLEAMLVVVALVAYLRRSGYADRVRVIWCGVACALVASAAVAWVFNAVLGASGANREAMEGVTMLVAAAVLVQVGHWLAGKRDADRWNAFIKGKMEQALGRRSLFALGFTAFLAVFREGAETILFYQALLGGVQGGRGAIWVGMGLGAVALAGAFLLIRLASVRLPLGPFFGATAVFLFGMAFMFAGKGVFELQASGWIPTNGIEGWPMVSWLGVFPTRETLLGQALVLATLPLGWLWLRRKGKPHPAPAAVAGR